MNLMAIEGVGQSLPAMDSLRPSGTLGVNFATLLIDGAQTTDRAILAAQDTARSFAAGENIAPHQVMLALEESRQAFQLALQVRNKLVEAYQELTRMQL